MWMLKKQVICLSLSNSRLSLKNGRNFKLAQGPFNKISLKGGQKPLKVTPRHIFLTIWRFLYSQRAQMPLRGVLSAVFYINLGLNYCDRLAWRHLTIDQSPHSQYYPKYLNKIWKTRWWWLSKNTICSLTNNLASDKITLLLNKWYFLCFKNGKRYSIRLLPATLEPYPKTSELRKAFDTVNHKLLLHTLGSRQFSPSAVVLLESYLTNRSQIMKVC